MMVGTSAMAVSAGSPPGPSIRAFEGPDREHVVALWDACGLTEPWNDPDQDIALFTASPGSEILIAEQDGGISGTVCVGHDGHRGWIYYLGVAPEHRGKPTASPTAVPRRAPAITSWVEGTRPLLPLGGGRGVMGMLAGEPTRKA